MKQPSAKMVRVLLKDKGAKVVFNILTRQGFEVSAHDLRCIREEMVKSGEARYLGKYNRAAPAPAAPLPEDSSRALLRLQLTTGQHSISDPRRIADLLLDLAA